VKIRKFRQEHLNFISYKNIRMVCSSEFLSEWRAKSENKVEINTKIYFNFQIRVWAFRFALR